jgi:hypothetical protein
MSRRTAALVFGLLPLFPGCVTAALEEKLTKPITHEERGPTPPAKIEKVTNASVAVIENRLELVLEVACHDHTKRFWATSLAGRDEEEPAPRAFVPLDLVELPDSIVPVRFLTDARGFQGQDARWWRDRDVFASLDDGVKPTPITRTDLESAALVSVTRDNDHEWHVWASVPYQTTRYLEETLQGLVPRIDEEDATPIVLHGPEAPILSKETCERTGGKLAFVLLAPFAGIADVGLGCLAAAGVVVLLPMAALTFPLWAHDIGC